MLPFQPVGLSTLTPANALASSMRSPRTTPSAPTRNWFSAATRTTVAVAAGLRLSVVRLVLARTTCSPSDFSYSPSCSLSSIEPRVLCASRLLAAISRPERPVAADKVSRSATTSTASSPKTSRIAPPVLVSVTSPAEV